MSRRFVNQRTSQGVQRFCLAAAALRWANSALRWWRFRRFSAFSAINATHGSARLSYVIATEGELPAF
ncbi:MAG: hypothetical protein H6631_09625 [Anaerolineaceae bacterium]|nr:hypothetical protein [Anaerolineaceae bacterium]